MLFRIRRAGVALALTVSLGAVAAGCAASSGSGGASGQPPSGAAAEAGRELVATKCVRCHTLDRVQRARRNRAAWQLTISRMRAHGLILSADDEQKVLDYLESK